MTINPTPPHIIAVTVRDGYLYAVSKAGQLLALYFYSPLLNSNDGFGRSLTAAPVEKVPFVDHWPLYTKGFVEGYMPVPTLEKDVLPDDIEDYFGRQPRPDSPGRPWDQAVFGGYPLYIFGDGTTPDPTGSEVGDAPTSLFQQVRASFKHGPIPLVKDGPTMPPVYVGP